MKTLKPGIKWMKREIHNYKYVRIKEQKGGLESHS